MVNLGIIGCGGIGNHHAGILAKMTNVRVAVVCDIVEHRAQTLAGKLGCEFVLDYRGVMDKVDAVFICTPPEVRVDVIAAAARAGKQIFCEKPIALNVAEADQIIRIVEPAGVKFMLGYVLRFTQPYKLLHDCFASGELGGLVNCWTRRYMGMDPRKTWHNWQDKSGGVALDFGSHDIDWLMWVGGTVKTVFAHAARVREGVQSDEHSQSMLVFGKGGMGCADVSWLEAVSESSIGVIGTAGSMSVDRAGTVRRRMWGSKEETVATQGSMSVDPQGKLGARTAEGAIQAVAQETETIQQHFIRCIEQDVPPAVTAEQGRNVLEAVLAINESARTGRAVKLRGARG